ncbi:MAG TPA: NAD(FAD)-dependent dehydrogenase, partial [Pseudomonas sp.]|nr:NAD(FAD)-dependent dehydrogenase [Pseudomonas sp.]
LMGACQDCWVWTADGERLRACGTEVREGLQILTTQPEAVWNRA